MQVADTIDGVAIHLTRDEATEFFEDLFWWSDDCCQVSGALYYALLNMLHPAPDAEDQADGTRGHTSYGMLASPYCGNNDLADDGN